VLTGWIIAKTTKKDIALIVIGSLIPDISKLDLFLAGCGFGQQYFFESLHTPVGTLLITGLFILFFENPKQAIIPLGLGIATHFILDFFLINVSRGMKLLFPFNSSEWNLGLIRGDDYWITIYVLVAALIVYIGYFLYNRIKTNQKI
jgi:hypothetical protein